MTLKATAASPAPENTEIDTNAEAFGAETLDANSADSSAVDTQDAKEPVDLLSVVKSAVEKTAAVEESSASESDQGQAEADAGAGAEEVEAGADADADLPFHNHPRWKAVIAERDSFKEAATKWDYIEDFRNRNGLSIENIAEGFDVMASLASGDPAKLAEARDYFAKNLSLLDQQLGNVLPEDLQERVDGGYLDEDGALEIARSRATLSIRQASEETRTQREADQQQQRQVQDITNEMVTAVHEWEGRIKTSDPDYSKKERLIQDRCRSLVGDGTIAPPRTAAEATALADRAHREITAEMTAALPRRRPITPSPAGTSTPTAREPKTLREAINGAVGL